MVERGRRSGRAARAEEGRHRHAAAARGGKERHRRAAAGEGEGGTGARRRRAYVSSTSPMQSRSARGYVRAGCTTSPASVDAESLRRGSGHRFGLRPPYLLCRRGDRILLVRSLLLLLTEDAQTKIVFSFVRPPANNRSRAFLHAVKNVWAFSPDAQNHLGRVEEIRKRSFSHPMCNRKTEYKIPRHTK